MRRVSILTLAVILAAAAATVTACVKVCTAVRDGRAQSGQGVFTLIPFRWNTDVRRGDQR